jgi:hypothetical protein
MNPKLLLAKLWSNPLLLGFLAVLAGLVYFAFWQKWNGISLSLKLDDLVTRMSPLILTSAFVERAVEILISPWRDAGASKLENAVTAIKARPNDPTTPVQNAQNALDLQAAAGALDSYRGQTQRYAFAAGLVLSFCASAVGVRALWPFVTDVSVFKTTTDGLRQSDFFRNYDVIITTALLAGGADGLHAIISSITSFFQKPGNTSS